MSSLHQALDSGSITYPPTGTNPLQDSLSQGSAQMKQSQQEQAVGMEQDADDQDPLRLKGGCIDLSCEYWLGLNEVAI